MLLGFYVFTFISKSVFAWSEVLNLLNYGTSLWLLCIAHRLELRPGVARNWCTCLTLDQHTFPAHPRGRTDEVATKGQRSSFAVPKKTKVYSPWMDRHSCSNLQYTLGTIDDAMHPQIQTSTYHGYNVFCGFYRSGRPEM